MVATCRAAGVQVSRPVQMWGNSHVIVKVIADAVTNHMSGADQGIGTANSSEFLHVEQ